MSIDAENLRDSLASIPAVPGITEPEELADYWFGNIDLEPAADFLDIPPRTLREFRWKGGGPPFVQINKKLKKYRRFNLHGWSTSRLRTSTSETA